MFVEGAKVRHHKLAQVSCCIEGGCEAAIHCHVPQFVEVQLAPYCEDEVWGVGDPLLLSQGVWGGFLCSPENGLEFCCVHLPLDAVEYVPGSDAIDIVVNSTA